MTYLFNNSNGRFIVNVEHSKIGYAYPRIFVEGKDEYVNLDLTIGQAFFMTKSDFESWLDGTEIVDKPLDELCDELGIKYNALISVVDEILIGTEE